jgi:signal transduction histidine kinase
MQKQPNSEKQESRVEHLEKRMRFIQNAIELCLSAGDYQEEINKNFSSRQLFKETGNRIDRLFKFETQAFYIINQENLDFVLSVCKPDEIRFQLEAEVEFLIEKGFMAWALHERRGITIPSKNNERQIFLHVIATYSSIRGVFIGLFPVKKQRVSDAAFEILSIILRNLANAVESIEYRSFKDNQKRLLEEQLHQKTKELIQYDRKLQNAQKMEAIATLAGGIAHEFNNALSGVMLNIDILKMTFSENSQIIKHIDASKRSAKYMAKLTKQLLAYAQGGKYKVMTKSFNEIIKDALPAAKHVISPSIQVETNLLADLYSISADLTQFQMVLVAILANASEAIEANGRILIHAKNVKIDELCTENDHEIVPGPYVCLTIEDNGAGMDENTCRRIFEPFFTTRFQGRGLGMSAAYGIIKNHGGWISVDSETGKGSKVKIFLPKAEIAPEEKGEPKHIQANKQFQQLRMRNADIAVNR